MRLVVLAAGTGDRMGPLGRRVPKCLLPLPDGTTLLQRLLEAASAIPGIQEVVIVGGFKVEQLEEAVSRSNASCGIRVITNPFYSRSGPLVSLWLAQPWLEGSDFMICNGDTYYGASTLARLPSQQAGIALGVDTRSRDHRSDAVAVLARPPGVLYRAGKDIRREEAYGVSIGLVAIRGSRARDVFASALNGLLRTREGLRRTTIWHTVLNRLAEQGVQIDLVEVDPSDWYEIDTPEDVRALETKRPPPDQGKNPALSG